MRLGCMSDYSEQDRTALVTGYHTELKWLSSSNSDETSKLKVKILRANPIFQSHPSDQLTWPCDPKIVRFVNDLI